MSFLKRKHVSNLWNTSYSSFFEEEMEKTPSDYPDTNIYKVISKQRQHRLQKAD